MSRWSDFYKDRVKNDLYESYFDQRYSLVADMIVNSSKDKVIHEIGCGIGSLYKSIKRKSDKDIHYVLSDIDDEMVKLSKDNTGNKPIILRMDCLNSCSNADVVVSHGLLEHLSDDQINKIVDSRSYLAKTQIHYVPGYKYEKPSFGDERLLKKDEWNKICRPSDIIEFNDGYDYILIFKK